VKVALKDVPAQEEADLAAAEPAAGTFLPEPSQTITANDLSLGAQAATESLKDEIAELKAENRKLLLENQAVAERLQAEDDARKLAIAIENERLKEDIAALKQEKEQAVAVAQSELERTRAAQDEQLRAKLAALQQEKDRAIAEVRAQAERELAAQKEKLRPSAVVRQEVVALPPEVVPQPAAVATLAAPPAGTAVPGMARSHAVREGFLDGLLAKAHIRGTRQRSSPAAYTWANGNIYGAAEERVLAHRSVEEVVDEYIRTAGSRCKGDFAHTLGPAKTESGLLTLEGELACMDGRNDAAAAVLFVGGPDRLAVITHEGPAAEVAKSLAGRASVHSFIAQ
jgi:hypothetical protein